MLRLLHRDLNKLNTQAHVARDLNPKANKSNDKHEKNSKKGGNNSVTSQIKKVLDDPMALLRTENKNSGNKNNKGKGNNNSQKKTSIPTGGGHVLGRAERKPSVESSLQSSVQENAMEINEETSSNQVEEPINFVSIILLFYLFRSIKIT